LNERIKGHPWFGALDTPMKFNPGKIVGGDWASSTPAWCDVDCRIAVLPGMPLAEFRRELVEAVMAAAARDPFLADSPPEVVWNGFQAEDQVLEPGSPFEGVLRTAHREVIGAEAQDSVLPLVADTRFYGRYYGIPSLCYGPIAGQAHGYDEFVDLASLKQATTVIALMVAGWCGVRPG
jgi:acetylornithine deacetylase